MKRAKTVMTAAVLCPGPSLASLKEVPSAGIIIGVNRAALRFKLDWWSVFDPQTIGEVTPLGNPAIFTTRASTTQASKYGCAERIAASKVLCFEDIAAPPRGELGWSLFSATAAMALAWHLGARRIEVYGADMAGIEDYDGCSGCRDNRTNSRWDTEKGIVNKLVVWVREHGGEIRGLP